ncbi:Cystinosin [Hondaea fermentalgiana]|uniref:Cystinosin n=1 Tax=Hondaea fermentalgiana TaxID=2315210 RepID=A0A2R5GBC7_9STRA|nr:Cystinosin [Hondaea fermentalgiana]|eukprot:GBG28292.1 Cystinosin [Hondaea fermentalgiana]
MDRGRSTLGLVALVGVFIIGLVTLAYAEHDNGPGKSKNGFWRALSWVIGWLYFVAWSVSFYPQLVLNYQRKSTEGLSYDFIWLNLLGFVAYSIFNVAFFSSSTVRESYRRAHDGEENLVRANDVFFALHATVVTGATLWQMYYCGYRRPKGRLVRPVVFAFIGLTSALTVVYLLAVLGHGNPMWEQGSNSNFWTMLSWLYFVSYIKLVVSFVKYCPQVYLNYQRKSTQGWSIVNVSLDFTGGFLSFLQLFIDASLENDWSGIYGDPVKLGLSLLSLGFDIIFMIQHFVLYGDRDRDEYFASAARHDSDAHLQLDTGDQDDILDERQPLTTA